MVHLVMMNPTPSASEHNTALRRRLDCEQYARTHSVHSVRNQEDIWSLKSQNGGKSETDSAMVLVLHFTVLDKINNPKKGNSIPGC